MADEPAIRAFTVKTTFELISKLPPSQAKAVLEKIPADIAREVERATSLDWIPFKKTAAIADALGAVLTRAQLTEMSHASGSRFIENPMSRSMIAFSVKVTGATPRSIIRLNSASWKMISRNAGEWNVPDTASPNEADVVWTGVPAPVLASPTSIQQFADGMNVVFVISRTKGTITSHIDQSRREIRMHHVWDTSPKK